MQRIIGSFGAAAAIALCACSQKDAAKPDSPKVAQEGAAASKASYDPTTHIAVIHTKDFAFDAPDSVNAGWTTFHLLNDGPNIHHVQFVRLDSGKTVQDLVPALDALIGGKGPPAAWMTFVAGPNAPNPGTESDATVNLEAGNYAVVVSWTFQGMWRVSTMAWSTRSKSPRQRRLRCRADRGRDGRAE